MALSVLLVEDDVEKARRITRVVMDSAGVPADAITHVTTLRAARVELQRTAFDLLLLDLILPSHVDQDPRADGGLELLDEIFSRDRYLTPAYVVGMTQDRELFGAAAEEFRRRTLALLLYEADSDAWAGTLQAAVRHIQAASAAKRDAPRNSDAGLAIVCALPLELDAVRRLPWGWEPTRVAGDATVYYRGRYPGSRGETTVYAASAPRMGMVASAVLATKLAHHFRPEVLAMTGIAAGVRGRVNLGDVVVADPAWDWGNGKWVLRDNQAEFEPSPHQLGLHPTLRTAFGLLAEDWSTLGTIQATWSGDSPPHPLRILASPMASGASVLADGVTTQRIVAQHRKVLAIEMEAYAVMVAADEIPEPRPRCCVLKAIVDFADGEKSDSYQRYGAYASAEVLRQLAERLL